MNYSLCIFIGGVSKNLFDGMFTNSYHPNIVKKINTKPKDFFFFQENCEIPYLSSSEAGIIDYEEQSNV